MEIRGGVTVPELTDVAVDAIMNATENVRQWEITIATEQTSNTTTVILVDSWFAEHFSDSGLCLVFSKASEGKHNSDIMANIRANSSNMIISHYGERLIFSGTEQNITTPLNQSTLNMGYLYLTEDGSLKCNNGSSVKLYGGDYKIFAWIM